MDNLSISFVISGLYYAISLFFLVAVVRNFLRTSNAQEAVLYGIIMVPFVLRLLRLK